METDQHLAKRACAGDRRAFTELVRRHQGVVRGMLSRLSSGHRADADDLSQAAFLRAWTQIHTYAGGQFRSWLCTIAYREFLQSRRKAKARKRLTEAAKSVVIDHVAFGQTGLARDIEKALALLSEDQRIAIVLCVSAGLTHAEASLATGWPLGTVKSHVTRGKVALQKHLSDYDVA